MASFIYYHLLFTLAVVFLYITNSEAQLKKPKGTALIFPIRKDPRTLQYYTTLKVSTNENYVKVVMDLSGQFTWFNCDVYNLSTYQPITCGSKKCKNAIREGCMGWSCTMCKSCNLPSKPGCTNNTCSIDSYNPFTNYLSDQGLGEDTFFVDSTDGLTITSNNKSPKPFQFSCANPVQLRKLPAGTKGMTGLSNTILSLHVQMSALFKLPHIFALCMPSASGNIPGHMFVGGGPYMFPPYSKDIAEELITTPLVINPQSTAVLYAIGEPSKEYFIDVKSIAVDGKLVEFNSSLLSINEVGDGGTKFTSIFPYTYLETSIYKALVSEFTKAAALRKMKRVASVAPFGACFSTKNIAKSQTGPVVPRIDFILPDDKLWSFYGGNSMVSVNEDVMCLAFVDADYKANPKTSIGIGGYQLENYLIEFDLVSSMVRISTSLLLVNATCSQSRLLK